MMNEVVKGLWLGDLPSAMHFNELKANKIFTVLSVMRGNIPIHETFLRHQISIDDTEDTDILSHLSPSVHFIQGELNKGRSVLVHCQAGVSRSATIIAAYLMYSRNINPEEALIIIRKARPFADPNHGFLRQLDVFHKADFKTSNKDAEIRRFYLARAADEITNSGTIPRLDMLSSYPQVLDEYNPATSSPTPRRRIRCKMCRQELATREHLFDHGQLGQVAPPPLPPPPPPPPHVTPTTSVAHSETQQDSPTIDPTEANAKRIGEESEREMVSVGLVRENSGVEMEAVKTQGERTTHLTRPANPTAQLFADPRLAALRPPLPLSDSPASSLSQAPISTTSPKSKSPVVGSSILLNPQCSGYFVEPMKWMDSLLQEGHLSGKISCPNKRCGSKLGNYDWAGMRCGCNEWVVPAFCINRSKVDEVAI